MLRFLRGDDVLLRTLHKICHDLPGFFILWHYLICSPCLQQFGIGSEERFVCPTEMSRLLQARPPLPAHHRFRCAILLPYPQKPMYRIASQGDPEGFCHTTGRVWGAARALLSVSFPETFLRGSRRLRPTHLVQSG